MYPSTLSTFTDPAPNDRLNNPSHSSVESAQNSGIERLENFVGTLSSTAGTLIYDIRATASDGGGHVQTAVKGGTGQTTFTKGDILVATTASVLSKLAVGATTGFALVVDPNAAAGIKWGVPGNTPVVRVYNQPSTLIAWIKPSNLSYIEVEVLAAGGSGEGGTNTNGGGGGAGGYAKAFIPASLLSGREDIVIGNFVVGSVGGLSRFGSILTTTGGGAASSGNGGAAGSVAGTYSSSSFGIQNSPGGAVRTDAGPTPDMAAAGSGGDSPYGKGGAGAVSATAAASGNMVGQDGTGYGSGGGGAINTTPGRGASGLVIIKEF